MITFFNRFAVTMSNPFFKNNGPFLLSDILTKLNLEIKTRKNQEIFDIKDLFTSDINDIIFFILINTNI